jgi:hypothetical protein
MQMFRVPHLRWRKVRVVIGPEEHLKLNLRRLRSKIRKVVGYQIAIRISAPTSMNSPVSNLNPRNAQQSTRSSWVARASKVRLTFPIFECGDIKLKVRNATLCSDEVGPPEDQPRRISNWLHTSVRLLKPAQSRLICIPRWDLGEEKASQLWGTLGRNDKFYDRENRIAWLFARSPPA